MVDHLAAHGADKLGDWAVSGVHCSIKRDVDSGDAHGDSALACLCDILSAARALEARCVAARRLGSL